MLIKWKSDFCMCTSIHVGPVSTEISHLCEISDLLLFVSYFSSLSKGIKFGDYFLMCVV